MISMSEFSQNNYYYQKQIQYDLKMMVRPLWAFAKGSYMTGLSNSVSYFAY